MQGTEKQMQWAEDLVRKFNQELDNIIAMIPEREKQDAVAELKVECNVLFENAYAGDIIDSMKYLDHLHGIDYYERVTAAFRLSGTRLGHQITDEICQWTKLQKQRFGDSATTSTEKGETK